MNEQHLRRYTADELRAMSERGESRTDWARIDAMTEEELEAAIASDPDWKDVPEDWVKDAIPVRPGPRVVVELPLDAEVAEFYAAGGELAGARMNAVLRLWMRERQKARGGGGS